MSGHTDEYEAGQTAHRIIALEQNMLKLEQKLSRICDNNATNTKQIARLNLLWTSLATGTAGILMALPAILEAIRGTN